MNPKNYLFVQTSYTLNQWLDEWLINEKECYVKPSTAEMYRYMVQLIEKYPIARQRPIDITGADVEQLLNTLYRVGYSKSTLKKVKCTLKQALTKLELYPMDHGCRIPAAPEKVVQALTPSEQERLRQALKSDRLGHLYIFLMLTGLRRSELINLQWRDCDMIKKCIYIRKSKTKSGIRCLLLVPEAYEILCSQPNINKFVFNNTNGTPLTDKVLKRLYERLRKKADIPNLNNHVLRHTFATNLFESDCPVRAISFMLGHVDEKSTAPYLSPQPAFLMQQIFRLDLRHDK